MRTHPVVSTMEAVGLALAACGAGTGPQATGRLVPSPPWGSIEAGDSITRDTVHLTFLDATGSVVPADAVTWSSSDRR